MASFRLPATARPTLYDLQLTPNLESFTFEGVLAVTVQILEATDCLVMHGLNLSIDQASVKWVASLKGGTEYNETHATRIGVSKDEQRIMIHFPSDVLTKGENGILHIKWTAALNDNLCGFYRSAYKVSTTDKASGKTITTTKYMATTQFEATDARRAFPCWDEPELKARFNVTLIVPADRDAISNMPVVERLTIGKNLVKIRFDSTPIMSTYLLAFVVGEFDYIATTTANRVNTRVYVPRGKTALAEHALAVASKALSFYEKEFAIPYPLPKSDLLAIPDFAAGAMENWGCVTYRETRLLVDKKASSLAAITRTTRTVCHELAHMWFGNLVTMKWWTHLWLNEGFARFMEFKAVHHIFPQWHIWLQFAYSVHGAALGLDALATTHPIEVNVSHPDEINQIFDTISYAKGASVIRMLHEYLGAEVFMRGIQKYLKDHAYANAQVDVPGV